jgi:hypothetical protein
VETKDVDAVMQIVSKDYLDSKKMVSELGRAKGKESISLGM